MKYYCWLKIQLNTNIQLYWHVFGLSEPNNNKYIEPCIGPCMKTITTTNTQHQSLSTGKIPLQQQLHCTDWEHSAPTKSTTTNTLHSLKAVLRRLNYNNKYTALSAQRTASSQKEYNNNCIDNSMQMQYKIDQFAHFLNLCL